MFEILSIKALVGSEAAWCAESALIVLRGPTRNKDWMGSGVLGAATALLSSDANKELRCTG
jgi:hypothetical protein